MIPTQPGVPQPTWPNNPFERKGWQCPSCGQWIGDMQYHACSGTNPNQIGTGTLESIDFGRGGIVMSDWLMYTDLKRLLRSDTLAKFRENLLERLLDIEQDTLEHGPEAGFGIDVIMDVFDEVAKGINHSTDV